jgi:O-antigen/teichoic acid export membrane protein
MVHQVLWSLVVRLLMIVAGFISSIITARFFGPEGRGVFFYWSTLAAFAIQFGNLGLHSSNTYLLTKGRAQFSVLSANSLWISIIGGVVIGGFLSSSLLLIDGGMGNKLLLLWPVLLMIPSGLYFLLGTNLLVADGRIDEYNGFELANRYLGLAAILFSAWCWRSPEASLGIISAASVMICLPLYHRLKVLGGVGRGSFIILREGFGYAIRAYLACLLAFAVFRLNAIFIGQYTDKSTLGTWSIAAQLLDVILVIPTTIALVLLPRIMRSEQPYHLMKAQLRLVIITLVFVCAVIAWLGHNFIMLVYGDRFAGAYAMLLWGLPGIFALGLTSVISQYLAVAGIPLGLVFIWMIGLVVELVLSLWLIPSRGGIGAMMSLSGSYVVILGMVWVLAHSNQNTQRTEING